MKKHNLLKAFTLTEVIIVLVILGALALILIPNFAKMMPDTHNIQYKKAYYTIQEIMNDIVNDPSICTGMLDTDGDGVLDTAVADNVFLTSCNGNLRNVISDRLSTVQNEDYDDDIQTTNNMRWFIPNDTFSTLFTGGASQTIIVSLDNNAPNNGANAVVANESNGIFGIVINANGKVTPGTTANEQNLLLDNPNRQRD